jgi:1,4-alpha-glucan branching enzyme
MTVVTDITSAPATAADGPSPDPARSGMGAIPHEAGCAFRVWAPHASAVHVTGDFNDWSEDAAPMASEEGGFWYADVEGARPGQEYRFRIDGPEGPLSRIDPYAREVTNSVGNAVIHDPAYDWQGDDFQMPPWNRLVIYELHVGTFNRTEETEGEVGTFAEAVRRFDHLKALGVNAIQIMPAAEFAGDLSWGYNPAHVFAVESAYGGPRAFKDFVRAAHAHGLAVILDVVYNHFGPSDLDLWRFDGWSEGDGGGIYFYPDGRAATPWGETRPDYGRPEVRQFIRDNALHWLEEYRVDGLRFDMTLYIRCYSGDESEADQNPDGWSLLRWINEEVRERFPGRITIAEDLRQRDAITEGEGAGFGAQWDAAFVHPVREVLIAPDDDHRDMGAIEGALTHAHNGDPFQRVVYTESHDEVANGRARVPHEIDGSGDDAHSAGWAAQKRATLGAALVMTAPGIPMMFQGQEFLQGDWFDDSAPLDWAQAEDFRGIVRLWRDLIRLRLDEGEARGLSGRGIEVLLRDDAAKLLAYRRFEDEDDDGVLVVMNFRAEAREATLGLPRGGAWRLRLDTDWGGYSDDFGGHGGGDLAPEEAEHDGRPHRATVTVAPYSALVFTR